MRHRIWFPVLVLATACNLGKKGDSEQKAAGSANETTAAAAPAAGEGQGDLAKVDLKPLPLEIQVKPGGMGAMDMSAAGKQSVTVDIGDGASLNIQPSTEKFAEVKKGYEKDTILFPFKKWEKDGDSLAVMQFDADGKKGYIGFQRIEVGGKAYYCKTTGMNGQPSADDAEKHLKHCADIKAK